MKKFLMALSFFPLLASAQNFEGKEIYIPIELKDNIGCDTCKWDFGHTSVTEDFIVFWDKRFGNDLSNPPELEGHDMSINLQNLENRLERFYKFYRDTLKFVDSESLADKYRMMVMLQYSLEGTAYGGDYDKTIGAFWVAPNRLKDMRLNCVAHELGHSFQMQGACDNRSKKNIAIDDFNEWPGFSFYEITSQWMLWHVNPDWIQDEKYHWDAFRNQPFVAFGGWENCYHTPYVLEWWSQNNGLEIIGKIFKTGKDDEDAVDAYKRLTNKNQQEFCDEIHIANCHTVKLDFKYAFERTRKFADEEFRSDYMEDNDGWKKISTECAPGNYGFNVLKMDIAGKKALKVEFENLSLDNKNSGFQYSFVICKNDGSICYSDVKKDDKGSIQLKLKKDFNKVYLVTTATPKVHSHNPLDPEHDKPTKYFYRIKF